MAEEKSNENFINRLNNLNYLDLTREIVSNEIKTGYNFKNRIMLN